MASLGRVERAAGSVCGSVERLRDVSRLILDAIERDDLPAMQRHVNESERLVAEIGAELSERRGEGLLESKSLLDHIRVMNCGMVERLRERQDALAREIGRARAFWHGARRYRSEADGVANAFDRET